MFLGQLLSVWKGTRSAASGASSGTGVNACDHVGRPGGSIPGTGQTWRLQFRSGQLGVGMECSIEIINPEHRMGARMGGWDGKMS